jgi:hypothetical protein
MMNAEELELEQLELQVQFATANKLDRVAVKLEVLKSLLDAYGEYLKSENASLRLESEFLLEKTDNLSAIHFRTVGAEIEGRFFSLVEAEQLKYAIDRHTITDPKVREAAAQSWESK